MSKEKLFEQIRREDVVLFAGAGMSIYAGYPSGAAFAKILYDNLTKTEQDNIEFTNDLPAISDDIYNLQNGQKNYLLKTVRSVFSAAPKSVETHQLIGKIPHFKTIITTNYDSLFEDNNKNLEVIRNSKDYPLADTSKQLLFKIHGDLTNSESIILTRTDYNRYFSMDAENTIFWNAVKDRLSSNVIMFVGYSLDDPNIFVMIDKILHQLGDHRKDIFLISPSIKEHKKKYLERNGIYYIQSSGEDLFKEIFEDLKLNYFPGLRKGNGTATTALKFADGHNLPFGIYKDEIGYNITDNGLEEEPIESEFKINFKLPKKEAMELLDTFNNDKSLDDISLDSASIKSFEQFTKGFRIKDEKDLKLVQFIKLPAFNDTIDIIFNDGEEFNGTTVEVFTAKPSDDEKHIKIILFDFTIVFKFKKNENKNAILANISILPNQKISNVANALKFFNIYDKFMDGIDFKIFKGSEIIYESLDVSKMSISSDKEHPLTRYFKGLKLIELHYGVRFSNIDIDDIDFTMLDCIIAYIQKRRLKIKSEPMSIKLKNKQEVEGFLEKINQKIVMISRPEEKMVLNFHDLEFNVGFYELIMSEAYITNYEDLKNGTTSEAIINSKSNSVYLQYVDNIIQIKTEPQNL